MDNFTHNNDENLVRFIDGEMEGEEKRIIEEQLLVDTNLKQAYASLLMTKAAVRYYGLQQQVKTIHQQMMKELPKAVESIDSISIPSKRKHIRYVIGIAASILLIIGGYIAYNFLTLSPDKVFSTAYQPYDLVILRDVNQQETAIKKAYKEKNYSEVLRIHDAGEDHSATAEFLCGLSSLETGDNGKAIKCFNEVLDINKKSSTKTFNDEAEYYLALSYVKNKNYNTALDLMKQIDNNPNHLYKAKITGKLIRQVKMLKWR